MAILGMLRRNFVQNIDSVRMNFVNLALFGTIFLLLHFGVEAESSSTCSLLDCLEGMGCQDNQGGMAVTACLELWALQEVSWVHYS